MPQVGAPSVFTTRSPSPWSKKLVTPWSSRNGRTNSGTGSTRAPAVASGGSSDTEARSRQVQARSVRSTAPAYRESGPGAPPTPAPEVGPAAGGDPTGSSDRAEPADVAAPGSAGRP